MAVISENINNKKGFEVVEIEKIVDFLKTFADKCHHGKEEKVLFPALVAAGIPEENGPVGVMLYEHGIGRGFIKEIEHGIKRFKSGISDSDDLIAGAMLKYVDLLRNHIVKENKYLFPTADKVLSAPKQDKISAQFEKIEEEVIGHGIHEKYHELLKEMQIRYTGKKDL